jgi:hypothetical protein
MTQIALSAVRWLFSEVLVIAVMLLTMAWFSGIMSR